MGNEDDKKELMTVKETERKLQPKEMVTYATDAAKILKEIVTSAKTSVKINGNEYLKFEAWQTIAKFYNATTTIEWTKPIMMYDKDNESDVIFGWEARANVIDENGRIIGSAESSCSREEKTWKDRANFQLKSMAQTRAQSKALRSVYSWVVVLAGYQPTPAEEMVEEREDKPMSKDQAEAYKQAKSYPKTVTRIDLPKGKMQCLKCETPITEKVYNYSITQFKKPFCYDCQKEIKKQLDLSKPPESEELQEV